MFDNYSLTCSSRLFFHMEKSSNNSSNLQIQACALYNKERSSKSCTLKIIPTEQAGSALTHSKIGYLHWG